jgi:ankyrin repeat protein
MSLVRSKAFSLMALMTVAAVSATAGDTRLADAAQNSDTGKVRSLLNLRVDPNSPQEDGSTALLWAAHNDDAAMAGLLLQAGANPKLANRYGVAPLSEAAVNGNRTLIELLLKAGAEPDTVLPAGDNVLILAAKTGKIEAVKALLDHGATVDLKEKWHGETALMLAAAENHAAVVKLLLDRGADPNAVATHLEWPDMKHHSTLVFSPYPAGGLTALMEAARNNALDATRVLVEGKADLNRRSPQGLSAEMIAILNAHWDLAELLLEHGADVNDGSLPLAIETRNLTFIRVQQEHVEKLTALDIIKDLLARGAKPDSELPGPVPKLRYFGTNVNGPAHASALYRAAKFADVTTMQLLIDKGADPRLKVKDGTTALHAAVGIGVALEPGAEPKQPQIVEAVEFLLARGADINSQNSTGTTALHGAAQKGFDDVVQSLADHGAKLDLEDSQGRTPLDIANAAPGKNPAAEGKNPEKHPTTAALLRKLMGLPADNAVDAKRSGGEPGKDVTLESAKAPKASASQ